MTSPLLIVSERSAWTASSAVAIWVVAAVDDDHVVGVDTVVRCVDGDRAVVDHDEDSGFEALGRGIARRHTRAAARPQRERSTRNERVGLGRKRVAVGVDYSRTACDEHVAQVSVAVFVGFETVAACRHVERTAPNDEVVFAPNAFVGRRDGDGAACYDQTVFARDAVLEVRGDSERSAAADGQVVVAPNGGVLLGISRIAHAVGYRIHRSVGQDEDRLVTLYDADARVARVRDVGAVEHQFHDAVAGRVDHELAVAQASRDDVGAGCVDGDRAPVGAGSHSVDGGGRAGERDARG